jgi:hypothetical protein
VRRDDRFGCFGGRTIVVWGAARTQRAGHTGRAAAGLVDAAIRKDLKLDAVTGGEMS